MSKNAHRRNQFELPYHTIRNISAPEDHNNARKVLVGHTPLTAIIDITTEENVRDFLLDAEGKKIKRPTQVHKAILDSLENTLQDFSVKNGGVTIVARTCEVNEKKKCAVLGAPSIINGAQTQGIIKMFLTSQGEDAINELSQHHIKFEIIVTDDEDLIAEISIARNFQNDVMSLSIAGRRGQLDELEKSFQKKRPGSKLKKSETKLSDDYIKTERLLQVIAALVPQDLWKEKYKDFNKVHTYAMKAKCLKDFQDIYKKAKDTDHPEHVANKALYKFYLDIAAEAYDLYENWKSHQGFEGTRLRSIQRDGRKITEVPDGIVFPILASLSAFAKNGKNGWTISAPESFSEYELIESAKSVYIEMANSNPNVMGKNRACYSSLYQITTIYQKLSSKN